ncbi:MAG: prolyl oligopeptidase family serine peptidase, partial [Pricia sp.]
FQERENGNGKNEGKSNNENENDDGEDDEFRSESPDGQWITFVKDHNLFIKSTETGEEHQLSHDGEKNYEYAQPYGWYETIKGESGDRPKSFSVDWSPDSKYLSTQVWDLRDAQKMYLLDWSIDSLYRPQLLSYYRGSPGDTTMVHAKPVFFDIRNKTEIPTHLPTNTHINAVNVRWGEEEGVAYADYAQRGFQKEYVLKVDLKVPSLDTLLTETSETNISNFRYWPLEEKGMLLFLSDRSGWRQLYTLSMESGEITPVTEGEFVVNGVEHLDKENGFIYANISGKDASMNPYHQQLYRVDLNGKMKLLTPEKAHHDIRFSEDGAYFTDSYSTVQEPTVTVLRKAETGKKVAELTRTDASSLEEKGWEPPQVFSLTAKNGKTEIYGALWKPTNFDPEKKYPIIDHSYTGPHTQMFPKSFDRALMNQALAELGFVVMMVDGLGTDGRSKAFADSSYKNMGDNLKDHVLAIEHLSDKYDWIDGKKVGIFGHSAGGYDAAHALLEFPETYKVAVASSADHDFRMEKAWWPEMYMGWPVDESYDEVSNITMADKLEGKLLLVHGGIDENVNPSATFKLAEALVNANKDFDLLILPSQHHGYQGKAGKYFTKKRWNYFVEHLLGSEPIWDIGHF